MSEIKSKLRISLNKLIKNIKKIPDEFFVRTDGGKYRVIWFMDRQRPSVEASYDFDMERFGITRDKRIIWGFDSGCSCPSPWSKEDYGDDKYNVKTWKEFEIAAKDKKNHKRDNEYNTTGDSDWFDETWEETCYSNLKDYLLLLEGKELNPEEVLKINNSEIRRYMIKRIGYENIKDKCKAEILHKDGTSELIKINDDLYVKVKDTSTEREYLLYVPNHIHRCKEGIAWTFGLREQEYNPIQES